MDIIENGPEQCFEHHSQIPTPYLITPTPPLPSPPPYTHTYTHLYLFLTLIKTLSAFLPLPYKKERKSLVLHVLVLLVSDIWCYLCLLLGT